MREMRRIDRKLSDEESKKLLLAGEYGVLATVCRDGTPYAIPVNYACDENAQVIYIHCSADGGQKTDNLRLCSKACLTVVANAELMPEKFSVKYRSAIAFGTVQITEDAAGKRQGIEAILRKYAPQYEEKGLKYIDRAIDEIYILKMSVDKITGKGRKGSTPPPPAPCRHLEAPASPQ